MSDELFVDAAHMSTPIPDGPAFFRSNRRGTMLYTGRAARIALTDQGRYRLNVVQVRRKELVDGHTEDVVKGGSVVAQVSTAPPVPRPEEWSAALRAMDPSLPADAPLTFEPLGLRDGKMSIYMGQPGMVEKPEQYLGMKIGSQTSVPINLALTPLGSETVWATLEKGQGLPITVQFTGTYLTVFPGAHYRITADTSKVYDLLDVNVKARASYFGLVDAKADVDVLRSKLVGSGAVVIEWIAKPEGFDESRIAELQRSIIDSFTRTALNLMVDSVQPDPAVAPNPDGFFGGVSVALKSKHEVADLHLSGEFTENDLREETFSYAYTFSQLPNLTVADYGVRVEGDNKLPISLNFGRNPVTIEKYVCQYGYVKPDGTVQSDRADASGADGMLFTGVVQWPQNDPRPAKTAFSFIVDWIDPSWDDYTVEKVQDNTDAGVIFTFVPNTAVKEVQLACTFERAEPGSLASFEWHTTMPVNPDGSHSKNYSGSVVYEGKGSAGLPDRRTIRFPFTSDDTTFDWEATLIEPDGTLRSKKGSSRVQEAGAVLLTPAMLPPAPPDAVVPRALAPLARAGR